MHGLGTKTFRNGDKYVGEWNMGLMHGKGTYNAILGDCYSGEFN